MSLDLKRSCDNDLEQNLHSKMKKRTTEETLMANDNAEHPLGHQMPINSIEHQRKQWLSLSLQQVGHMSGLTLCSKKLEDKVRLVPNNNIDQPARTSRSQQQFSESNGYLTRFTTEDHAVTFNAHNNESVLPHSFNFATSGSDTGSSRLERIGESAGTTRRCCRKFTSGHRTLMSN